MQQLQFQNQKHEQYDDTFAHELCLRTLCAYVSALHCPGLKWQAHQVFQMSPFSMNKQQVRISALSAWHASMCRRLPHSGTASSAAARLLLQQLLDQLPVALHAMRGGYPLCCVSSSPGHWLDLGNCHMTERVLTGRPQSEHVTAGVTVTVTASVTVAVTASVTAGVTVAVAASVAVTAVVTVTEAVGGTVCVTVTAGVTVLATRSGAERGTVGLAERVCADVGGAAGGKPRAS